MTTLLTPSFAQFGCSHHQSSNGAKVQFGRSSAHVCQFSGCCAQFGSTPHENPLDAKGHDGPGVVGVLGAVAVVIASLVVGKRLVKTALGTASTTIRDFFSRLFTNQGLVQKAQAATGQAQQYAQKAFHLGFQNGVQWWQRVEQYFVNLLKQ